MPDEVENGQAEGEKAIQGVDLSTSAQLRALREYAQRNGYQVVIDEAESGCTAARPAFEVISGKLKNFELRIIRPEPLKAR